MLILTRRPGDTVVIGHAPDPILCTFLGVDKNGHAKLGFDAPQTTPINRYEIHRRIEREMKCNRVMHELAPSETVLSQLMSQMGTNTLPH
jgi:carbon storage regulator CsrA